MKKRVSNYLQTLITCCFLLIATMGKAQNIGINVTGATPNAKAMLDIDATGMATKGGLLIPRLTTAERNAITAPIPMSLLIYNTTTNCFEAWNQTANSWIAFGCITCATPTAPAATAATANTSSSFIANWAAVTGATNYFLDVATNASFSSFVSGYNNINIGNSTAASITNLTCNTTYYYRVRAANTCTSSVSASSNTITITTPTCSGGGSILTGTNTPFGNFANYCSGFNSTCPSSPITDTRSGATYSVTQYFNQCWMAQDLKFVGSSGILIDPASTVQFSSGSNNSNNDVDALDINLNGSYLLYSWNEAMAYGPPVTGNGIGPQGICPTGWHIPTVKEWRCLRENVTIAAFMSGLNNFQSSGTFNSTTNTGMLFNDYGSYSFVESAAAVFLSQTANSGITMPNNWFPVLNNITLPKFDDAVYGAGSLPYMVDGFTGSWAPVYTSITSIPAYDFYVPTLGGTNQLVWNGGQVISQFYLTSDSNNPVVYFGRDNYTNGSGLHTGNSDAYKMYIEDGSCASPTGNEIAAPVRCVKD